MARLATTVLRACYTYGTPRRGSAPRVLHVCHASPRQCSARVTRMSRLAAAVIRASYTCVTQASPRPRSSPMLLRLHLLCYTMPWPMAAREMARGGVNA
eukprot:135079-Pyramimonas_sp.AAC.1